MQTFAGKISRSRFERRAPRFKAAVVKRSISSIAARLSTIKIFESHAEVLDNAGKTADSESQSLGVS